MRLATGAGSMRCDYCKSVAILTPGDSGVIFLEELAGGPTCPVCAVPLWTATLAKLQIRACNHCGSILVPMGLFGDLVEELRSESTKIEIPSPPDPEDLKQKVPCPICHRAMDVHVYMGGGGAIVADCEICELIWVDPGGLKRIVNAPHEGAISEY
jgi:Zn-finger nucleic acid-binding protein